MKDQTTAILPTTLDAAITVIGDLAVALQRHRVDMHHNSDRPCSTCSESASALRAIGIAPFVEGVGQDRRAAMGEAESWPGDSGSEGTR